MPLQSRSRRALELIAASVALALVGAAAVAALFYVAVQLSEGTDPALGMAAFFLAALGGVATVWCAGACFVAGMLELAGHDAPMPHSSPHQ